MTRRSRVLYISYNGSGTPLVRSQVLPYLRALRQEAEFHLLTFEGATEDPPAPAEEVGEVALHMLRYHKRPNVPAKLLDMATGFAVALWLLLRHRIDVVHARSHVPAVIAMLVGGLTRRPVIFDMRGFLADEYVEAGTWRRGGPKDRVARLVERWLVAAADAVVVLTRRAQERLMSDEMFRSAARKKAIVHVPCCVELDRYRPASRAAPLRTLVYAGSVGTWYLLDEMLRFFCAFRSLRPDAQFLILNRSQHALVRDAIRRIGCDTGVVLRQAEFREVPELLAACTAGIVLLRQGASKIASSPIKLAEYLACGLPVVVNEAVGDAPYLVRTARVGVILRGLDDVSLAEGARELDSLLREEGAVRERARRVAESEYSVQLGAIRYRELYARRARR